MILETQQVVFAAFFFKRHWFFLGVAEIGDGDRLSAVAFAPPLFSTSSRVSLGLKLMSMKRCERFLFSRIRIRSKKPERLRSRRPDAYAPVASFFFVCCLLSKRRGGRG